MKFAPVSWRTAHSNLDRSFAPNPFWESTLDEMTNTVPSDLGMMTVSPLFARRIRKYRRAGCL